MAVTDWFLRRIEEFEKADRLGAPLQRLAARLTAPRAVRNALSGTQLGHPVHPMLTDIPIGSWVGAGLLDTVGGQSGERAADLLVAFGIVAAVPTALAGLNDWSDTYGPDSRVGLAHAAGNTLALALYAGSLTARALGRRRAGRALGHAGLGAMSVSGYLGGHLSYARGVNVNRTAFEDRPTEWTSVAADADLAEGATVKVDAGGAPVLLHRSHGRLFALANTCTHLGGPLNEGEIHDGCVTCPWHGSVFRLVDGKVVRGPASSPQPTYQTRLTDGQIEVRANR